MTVAGHPRYVVISADPERRGDWARAFQAGHTPVLECAGPLMGCPLTRGSASCQLLDGAELAVYDLDSVNPTFLATLMRTYPHRSMIFARDAVTPGGRHQPAVKRFSVGRAGFGDVCFGELPR